ncbi:MAG: outer membrane protein assembly factor BamC, partial [Methylobacter sp.]
PDSEGLGSDVYMNVSRPMQLKIKRPVNDSWRYIGLALKQGQIRVIDHEQDKGLYYLYYKEKNIVENAVSLFKKEQEEEHHEANYVLTLKEDGAETKITVTSVNPAEQDPFDDEDVDTSEQEGLLWTLYETLKDDLKEE